MIVKTERKWLYCPLPVGPIGDALKKAEAEKNAKAEKKLLRAVVNTRLQLRQRTGGVLMNHVRKGRKAKTARRESAAARQVARKSIVPEAQIAILSTRPGESRKEIARLSLLRG